MNPLVRKMEQYTAFSAEDVARLDKLVAGAHRTWKAREVIIPQDRPVENVHLVLSGLAARSKGLPDGDRQIMAFLIPGDLCDVEVFVLKAMDHDIVALCETTCALIPTKQIEALLVEMSTLTKALWWSTMTDSAVLRERIIDHGRREAHERIAHLFYEMLVRYRVVGEVKGDTFAFPVTQEELADATGLTPVHVNRTLKDMREQGLVEFRDRMVRIPDPQRLKAVARFEAEYLHLDRTAAREMPVAGRAGDLV